MQANQNPTNVYLSNCQNVVIGDSNVISSQSSPVQENRHEKDEEKHKRVPNVLPEKPFHVSRTREEELNEIESLFSAMPEDENVVTTVYLTGQPGSGKTELARQYGELFKNRTSSTDTSKPLVITLNGSSEGSLFKSVKEATRKLRLSGAMKQTHPNLKILMKELRDYFRDYSGAWLLIVDDMFENDFNNLFPRSGGKEWGGGRVLVTTQDNNLVPPSCHRFAKKLSLNGGMTKEDALALLKEISDVEVDNFADEIIEELQCLPLALACCATFVRETREVRAPTQFGWKEYLELYRKNAQLESRKFSEHNDAYPFSMTTATTMAVKRMVETSDVLRLTFSFLSYCALLPVPLNVLAHYVKEVQDDKPSTTKGKDISEIENEILRCTLLQHGHSQNVETIKCHQVIHHGFKIAEDTKHGFRIAEERKTEFVRMMKFFNKKLDFMDNTCKEDILRKVLLRPHLKSFIDHANHMYCNNTAEFVVISKKKDQFLYSTSDMPFESTVKSLELLREIFSELDASDEIRCDVLANLGFYYLELERKEDASKVLSDAYSMTEDKNEKEWLRLRCRISFHLAQTYRSMENVHDGIEMMKTSIDLAKKVYDKEEDEVMKRFYHLAEFYDPTLMKFLKLRAIVNEATDFLSSLPDGRSLSRASCLDYLSRIYGHYAVFESQYILPWFRKYGKLEEEFINKSLEVYEHVLGDDVSTCPGYCLLMVKSAFLEFKTNPTGARARIAKALEFCQQNGDMYNYSCIAARKKHSMDNRTIMAKLSYALVNFIRGRWFDAEKFNICDDILQDCNSGRTFPSPRKLGPIKKSRDEIFRENMFKGAIIAIEIFLHACLRSLHSVPLGDK